MNTEEIIRRIKSQTTIDPATNCWLYTGNLSHGYGRIYFSGFYQVHRVSAHVYLGLDLNNKEQQALHKLECLNKNCWNPEHLYIGNSLDNTLDRQQTKNATSGQWSNNLTQSLKTHCPRGHEYTPENTKIQTNTGARKCRECDKLRKRGGRPPRNLSFGPYSSTKNYKQELL